MIVGIVVGDDECHLLRGTQTREEAELIVVALRLAPVAMDRGDQNFRILKAERIDGPSILLADACTLQCLGGIEALGMVAERKIEGTTQGVDGIVVRLLGSVRMGVGNFHELRETDRDQG